MKILEAVVTYDPTSALTGVLGTVSTALAAIIPAGLALWGILFVVGYGKKATKKSAS